MNVITPRLAGVTGMPIAHSLSPVVHGHWLRRYAIPGYYVPIALAPDAFEAGIAAMRQLGFRGVNVTVPHKENALALADETTDAARRIGAANTLTFEPQRGIIADCTDAYGFIENLRQGAPTWRAAAGPAVVLGAGGAARAVIHALFQSGAPEIRLANRTRARAEALSGHFGPRIHVVDWPDREKALEGALTLVNATSLGLAGSDDLAIRLDDLPEQALVTDIVYAPLITPLLQQARDRGLATVDGLGMLLHQAAPGFERWFGQKPQVDAELRQAVLEI